MSTAEPNDHHERGAMRNKRRLRLGVALACAVSVAITGGAIWKQRTTQRNKIVASTEHYRGIEHEISRQEVLSRLGGLAVRNSDEIAGYKRELFMKEWSTIDGCSMRNRILQRDLANVTLKTHCKVATGELLDPYTKLRLRIPGDEIQIDHVVSLSNAWSSGAYNWTPRQRRSFANDPRNLLAVQGLANEQKSDKDASEWDPANDAFDCTFAAEQVTVKEAYRLNVTAREKVALRALLGDCPDLIPIV